MARRKKEALTMTWSAPEYEYYHKSSDWYWVLGIITVGMFVVALILNSFLFAFLILIAGFALGLYGARRPKTFTIMLDARGVHVANKIFPHDEIESFWIEYDPPHRSELILHQNKALASDVTLFLGNANPNEVREYLLQFLEEKHKDESLVRTLSRVVGF